MFVNSGTRGNKTGLLRSLSAFPPFIKPGTRQTGLTGRFQKSFGMNSWHLLKVPKREIFDRSNFPDFYAIKSSWVGDLVVKILTYYFNF